MPSPLSCSRLPYGSRGGLIPITFLFMLGSAQVRFLEVRGKPAVELGKKRQLLLARRTRDPGFNRNFGVREGAPGEDMSSLGDDGSKFDSNLGYNWVTASSMSNKFRFLDNMNPVAPMDRVHSGDGAYDMDPLYIAEYLNPDAFPTVVGKGCMCKEASTPNGKNECDCGNHTGNDHYTWLKETPVPGTNNYTLTPADITYRAGDYWHPLVRGGIVSPSDRLPPEHYPNQALADHIWPLPVSANGDRIASRFSRYMDQVHARSEECEGDGVSKKCTVKCKPGDAVTANFGNMALSAKVIKGFVGNAVQVEFSPGHAAGTVSCPVTSGCSAFRYCKNAEGKCTASKEKDSHNWQGRLVVKIGCPKDTQVCSTVNQVMMASMLSKDGKTCKAAAR